MNQAPDDELAAAIQLAIGELLNIAVGVADLQLDQTSADDIYNLCDVVAEYFDIVPVDVDLDKTVEPTTTNDQPLKGHIRTTNRPKLRVSDHKKPKP